MDIQQQLETDCFALRDAIADASVDKDQRRRARKLLQLVFQVQSRMPEKPNEAEQATLLRLSRNVDAMRKELNPAPTQPIGSNATQLKPIEVQTSVRTDLLNRVDETYGQIDDRLQDMVDWFWERCGEDPNASEAEESLAAKAQSELPGADLEYVWGRKGRRS